MDRELAIIKHQADLLDKCKIVGAKEKNSFRTKALKKAVQVMRAVASGKYTLTPEAKIEIGLEEMDEDEKTNGGYVPTLNERCAPEVVYDQPCRHGGRLQTHAVYCYNQAWEDKPMKCRRTWYTGGEVKDEDCPGYEPREGKDGD